MRIALLSGDNRLGWPGTQLIKAIEQSGHQPLLIRLDEISALISSEHEFYLKEERLSFEGGIIRGLGAASTDEITYRISLLEHLNFDKKILINEPYAFRRAKDKYATLLLLSKNKIPVPKTLVTEDAEQAYKIAEKWGCVVIKPLIGSRGLGPIKSDNPDLSYRIIKTLKRLHQVLYVQEYIANPGRDIRVFVIGGRVIGGMYRVAKPGEWKSNIAAGAKPCKLDLNKELEDLAVKTASVMGLDYTGIDILESAEGYKVVEANAAPSWHGLNEVLKTDIAKLIIEHLISKIKS
ncbi:MAG: RimK family alpha-L-glutamate ligase [Candidatus Odinarchaeum yellowstonii]|uniref:RimK family alpha-L-glutamate ligase n=1 Tax=Odinarchaeota yellowstonii (strain LCB_4) TaxID=1841599 RepID=A0AAF0D1X1_ODILC|nr:MAG: RimK family alpha-L-glutamate ligase [Candidatus Odinarchaeum yellowstonii]